jgi:hypothetical protein
MSNENIQFNRMIGNIDHSVKNLSNALLRAMARRLVPTLTLIDNYSSCHGTDKFCAMARRLGPNLTLIDNYSSCHGTTILF